MKAVIVWAKENWAWLGFIALAAVVVYRLWPRRKTTITYTDIPVFSSTANPKTEFNRERELDSLIDNALADYDHG